MKTIALHNTENGYAVAIVQAAPTARFPRPNFQVVRVNPENKFVTYEWAKSEKEARKIANELWKRDMGRGPKMIGVGAPAI